MSAIDATHSVPAYRGPRYSASDRPLPPVRTRTAGYRVRISTAITAVVLLMAFGIAAPRATLALMLAVLVTAVVAVGSATHLVRRRWGPEAAVRRSDGVSRLPGPERRMSA